MVNVSIALMIVGALILGVGTFILGLVIGIAANVRDRQTKKLHDEFESVIVRLHMACEEVIQDGFTNYQKRLVDMDGALKSAYEQGVEDQRAG